jgi:hypothetical protein
MIGENRAQDDVQRRKEIDRLIERVKELEYRCRPVRWHWPRYRHAQRQEEEEKSRNYYGANNPPTERSQFAPTATQKRRGDVEEINRHVGNDEDRDEGDDSFPLIVPGPDVREMRREPVDRSKDNQEANRQSHRGDERGAFGGSAHDATRRASDTLKMPQ